MKKFLKVLGILILIGIAIELSPLFAVIAFGYGGYNLYKYLKYKDYYDKDKIEYRNLSLGSFVAVVILVIIASVNSNNKKEIAEKDALKDQQKQEELIAKENNNQKELETKKTELKSKEKESIAERNAKRQEELADSKDKAIEKLATLEFLTAEQVADFTEDINSQKTPSNVNYVLEKAKSFNDKGKQAIETKNDPDKIYQVATITNVTDGDTVTVGIYGQGYKTRLIGVDTPETVHPSKPVEFMGKEASDFTKEQLQDKKVWLEKDVSETDRYDRLLRYIWLEEPNDLENPTYEDVRDKMFNGILVRDGYANAATFPPDVKYQEYFARIEQEARDKGIGLWDKEAAAAYVPPQGSKKANNSGGWHETNNPSKNNGMIKGNKNSMIYHVPGGASYNKIAEHNTVYFNTEEEAQAAGYRRAER